MNSIKNEDLPAGLYLVATPIGNLRDITLRALDTLKAADCIICEDTRVTGKLLQAYDIQSRLTVYNDHNADQQRPQIIKQIKDGQILALVSDAGTPLISDPGYKLVRECQKENLYVTALPGANAPLTALQLSGMASNAFTFIGFLPSKTSRRKTELEQWKTARSSLILFESAKRLGDCLRDCLAVLGDRQAAVVREMTKMFEESRGGTISELIAYYEEEGAPKGEIVIVIDQFQGKEYSQEDITAMLSEALEKSGVKDAAAQVSEQTGQPKKQLYDLALKIKKGDI